MHSDEQNFHLPVRVRPLDIVFDNVDVLQTFNQVNRLSFGGANDDGIEDEIFFVNEVVAKYAATLAEVLERIVGVQRIDRDLEFLSVTQSAKPC